MTIQRFLRTACVLFVLTLATAARADDAAMAEAQARFKEGLDLADGSRFDEARLKFLQASAVLKDKVPTVLFNLAMTEQKTGHDVEAVQHYRAFLKTNSNDPRITDAMREKATQNIALLLPKVAQIDLQVVRGAKVSVDDKPLDETPKEPIAVAAGKHTIEASYNGKTRSIDVDAVVGVVTKARIDLEATEAGPPTQPSSGGVRTTAGWVVPIALGVLGVGGVVMGVVFASASQGSKDDSEAARRSSPGLCASPSTDACDTYRGLRSDAESQATLSLVGYVGGGVLLAASAATFLFWPESAGATTSARGMRLTPMLSQHGGGGSFELHF